MEKLAAIHRELDALEQVHGEIATIALRDDAARKRDLVELRRRLAARIAEVGRLAEPVFAGLAEEGGAQAYRAKFSGMRAAAAAHQARWPAVLLDDNPSEYRASAQRVRDANKEFVAWTREALMRLRSEGKA